MANVNKTVTNVDLVRDTGTAVTATALTSDVAANDTETLIITPTVPAYRLVVIINNVAADQGSLGITVTVGDYWMAKAMASVAVVQATAKAFMFTAARYQLKADSTIKVVIAPASGKKLVTNHAATWQCFQIPL
jgi:hypothetical protein